MRRPDPPPGALPDASGLRFAIVVSRFNLAITEKLRDGASAALRQAGAAAGDIEVYDVPGAFEIPQAARALAETGRIDAVVCLGCVIRGATAHFEYISASVAHGIQQAAGRHGRADGVRRADDRHVGAGGGARGRRAREQGLGGGGRRHRDGACCSAACAPTDRQSAPR